MVSTQSCVASHDHTDAHTVCEPDYSINPKQMQPVLGLGNYRTHSLRICMHIVWITTKNIKQFGLYGHEQIRHGMPNTPHR
jgi:hypothetical protein